MLRKCSKRITIGFSTVFPMQRLNVQGVPALLSRTLDGEGICIALDICLSDSPGAKSWTR